VKIGDTVTVIVTVAELMPEKSRARLTCVCKVGRSWFDSNIRIPFRDALLRMLETRDHEQA
jgi:hypothetical protein